MHVPRRVPGGPGRRDSVQVGLEDVEADVPAGAVAGGLPELVEDVGEDERAPGGGPVIVRLDLETDHVGAPPELQQRRRIPGQYLAVKYGMLATAGLERERRADRPLADDALREPGLEVPGLCDGPPHLLRRVRKLPGEPQLPLVACPLEVAVHVTPFPAVSPGPFRRDGSPARRDATPTSPGTGRASRPAAAAARPGPGRGAAARRPWPRRGPRRAAPAGASTPRAGSLAACRPGPRPGVPGPGEDRGSAAGEAPRAPRTPSSSHLAVCFCSYMPVKASMTLAARPRGFRRVSLAGKLAVRRGYEGRVRGAGG